MKLDEAIKHCEEVAKEQEAQAWEAQLQEEYRTIKSCKKCAEEHRQLAEWLKELKKFREQDSCENLCKSCDTKGCLFQSGIKRKKCDFYTHEKDSCEDWHEVPSDEMTLGQARQAVKYLRKFIMDNHILPKLQSCEDAISRQAVLDGLASIAKAKAKSDAQKSLMGRVMFFTEQLPPVTPKQKMGRWINSHIPESTLCECSECGFTCGAYSFNYCPNCGAKMEVE